MVNFVTGSGGAIGDAILEHTSLKAISFTGSCDVGNRLYEKATRRRLRVQLEMGGKNPTIVLADANPDFAAATLVNAAFFSTGQKCTACSRAIVERSVYEPLVERLIARTRALKIGNGAEAGIDIGPAVDASQLDTDLEYIGIAQREGRATAVRRHTADRRSLRQGLLHRADHLRRGHAGDAHRAGGSLRARAGADGGR